jgi:uncharacterized protein (TIGR02246 family)
MYRPYATAATNPSSFVDVESTIRGLTQDLSTAFNTANYDQFASLFATDGQLMPPHREAAIGAKAIERAMRELGESGCQDLRLETTRVDHAGDMAIELGRYTLALRQPNGTTTMERGKFVHAWRRLGAWLMVADCWNSNLPQATQNQ